MTAFYDQPLHTTTPKTTAMVVNVDPPWERALSLAQTLNLKPQKFNPTTKMPPHPTFDAKTLDALQAYFKTIAPP